MAFFYHYYLASDQSLLTGLLLSLKTQLHCINNKFAHYRSTTTARKHPETADEISRVTLPSLTSNSFIILVAFHRNFQTVLEHFTISIYFLYI